MPRQNQDYLRTPRRGERAASMDSPPPFSPTRTSVFSLLFITFPTVIQHPLHLLCQTRAQAPGVRTDISHGRGMAYECLAPVTVSQQAQTRGSARPLLLHQRLSPPMPDFTAYLVLKSPFCLCHFISTNNSRLEDLFSKWLILKTIKREMLDSGSSQPLWHYLEICLAAPFFGCGRFETSDMDDCKMCCVCIKKGQVFCKKE